MRPEEVSARGANLVRQAQGKPLPELSTRTETQWIDEMDPVRLAPMRDEVMGLVEAGDTRGARDLLAGLARKYAANNMSLVLETLETQPGPTLMFCGSGGRCAAFLAIYRAVVLGVPLDKALVEARRAGMKPGEPEDFVRSQVEQLRKES